jgi:hypothetical protein
MKATQLLHNLGQSIWLDNITRDLLDTGTLERYIDELSVTGCFVTRNPWLGNAATWRRQRGGGSVSLHHAAAPRACCIGSVAPTTSDAGSNQVRRGNRSGSKRLHTRRFPRWNAGGRSHCFGQRTDSRGACARAAHRGGYRVACGFHALLGHLLKIRLESAEIACCLRKSVSASRSRRLPLLDGNGT